MNFLLQKLQKQLEFLEVQEEYIKDEQKNLKKEYLHAQEEVKRIQSVPLVIGQFLEAVDQNNGIVGSTTGNCLNFLNNLKSKLVIHQYLTYFLYAALVIYSDVNYTGMTCFPNYRYFRFQLLCEDSVHDWSWAAKAKC